MKLFNFTKRIKWFFIISVNDEVIHGNLVDGSHTKPAVK